MKSVTNASEAGESIVSPAGTNESAQAGTSPASRGDRNMDYMAKGGTQKPHPAKPAQSNVLHYLKG